MRDIAVSPRPKGGRALAFQAFRHLALHDGCSASGKLLGLERVKARQSIASSISRVICCCAAMRPRL